MVGGRGVRQLPESGVDSPLFVALSLEGKGAAPGVRLAEAITVEDLEAMFPASLQTSIEAILDEERGAFTGVRRTRFADLIIDERDGVAVDDDAIARGLATAFAARWAQLFKPDDDALRLRHRLQLASRLLNDVEDWPNVDDEALQALLPEVCAPLVARGKRRLEDVSRVDWREVLLQRLSWQQRRTLDDALPERLTVPTGNQLKVDYEPALADDGAPVLAVRLQECFGWLDTPRVANGRLPVVLHLLSPGYKPVQVTRDLKSFWARGYVEVKKELKARYPKHSWPDDPLAAAPVAKGRSTKRP